jgi:hypothetical protein
MLRQGRRRKRKIKQQLDSFARIAKIRLPFSGNSSVGRARPCQGRGREFESRFPLQIHQTSVANRGFFVPDPACLVQSFFWLGGRVVMQRPAKPCTSVRLRAQPPSHSSKVRQLSIPLARHVSIAYPDEYPELVGEDFYVVIGEKHGGDSQADQSISSAVLARHTNQPISLP